MLDNYFNTVASSLVLLNKDDVTIASSLLYKSKQIFIVGNGGSKATAEHFSTDLLKVTNKKIFDCSNTSLLTMIANDYEYENLFTWCIDKYFTNDSIIFAITTSGNSKNILKCIENYGKNMILVTGENGAKIKDVLCKITIPSKDTQIVEDVSLSVCHAIAKHLGGEL